MTDAKQHQPLGTWVMFGLQIMGFVGFMMIFSLLVLYSTNALGLSDHVSYGISGAFNALAFAGSVPAAIIAERYLGFRFASFLSIIIQVVGLAIMCIQTPTGLYIGLGAFILGQSMMLPCFFVLLGRLYNKNDAFREWGFTLSYIGMNVGGFFASVASGYVTQYFGYNYAFLIGAIFLLLMVPVFFVTKHLFEEKNTEKHTAPITLQKRQFGIALTLLSVAVTIALVYFYALCNSLLLILGVASVIFMLKMAFNCKTKKEKRNLIIFCVLIVISVMFWTLYSLAPSALTIFTERNVDRTIFGHLIPASDFQSLNNFFIFTVGPLLSLFWIKMQKRKLHVSTTTKIASGTLFMGIGYLVLVLGITQSSALSGLMGVGWLVISYFFQTVGELMVGPVNYAMVGEFVPAKLEGTMMGISQFSTGMGGVLSVYFADYTSTADHAKNPLITNPTYSHAFLMFGVLTVAVALIAYVIAIYVKKTNSQTDVVIPAGQSAAI